MPLFEIAILQTPTKKEREDGGMETLIVAPEAIIAKDKETAAMAAVRRPEAAGIDLNRMEVIVRPFA